MLALPGMLSLSGPSAKANSQKDADILDTWTLTDVLDSAAVTTLTDQQAAALVGKVVARRKSVTFNGDPCRAPELTRHREDAAKYAGEGYHARVGNLGLSGTVAVMDIHCTEAFLKSKGKAVCFGKATSTMRQSSRQ